MESKVIGVKSLCVEGLVDNSIQAEDIIIYLCAVAWRSLRAKCMGVFVGLPVDRVWNGGSDLQAGMEIYY